MIRANKPFYSPVGVNLWAYFGFLIYFLLFTLSKTQAQTPSKELKFDSLVNANERYSKQDITKLKLLNLLALGYPNLNPEKGIETGEQAIILAQKLDNQLLLAEAYNNKGVNHAGKSDHPTAMGLYEKALVINQNLKNTFGIAYNLVNIGNIIRQEGDIKKAKEQFEKALTLFESLSDKEGIAKCYHFIALVYSSLSNYPKALEYCQKALALNEQFGYKDGVAGCLGNIGNVYLNLSDCSKALEYYQKSLTIQEQIGNKRGIAITLGNIGNVYHNLSDYPKAQEYYQKASTIHEQIGNKSGISITLCNIGNVYLSLFDYPKAQEYYQKSLDIDQQMDNKLGMAINLVNIGLVYHNAPDSVLLRMGIKPLQRSEKALKYINQSLKIAYEIGNVRIQKAALENISITYEKQGDFTKAYDAYKKYIVLRDSIESGEIKGKIERKTMQYEFDKKETEFKFTQQLTEEKLLRSGQEATLSKQALLLSNKEKDLQHLAYLAEKADKEQKENLLSLSEKEKQLQQAKLTEVNKEKEIQDKELALSQAEVQSKNQQRNGLVIGSGLLLLLAVAILIGSRKTAKEKQKSENLLLNILPEEVANELKQNGKSAARQYNHVTVLFTDFVNFTGLSEQMTPTELVAEIHKNFTAFDAIMEKHGLEKIKTIGDAYLAVCGLPNETPDHAQRVARAALDISDYMKQNDGKFQIRLGIHSGPVVAGIVGVKKYAYDIWGDTVNTASRMESSSEAGKINISLATYELIKHDFECTYRGKINTKNKGEVDMYFINRSLA